MYLHTSERRSKAEGYCVHVRLGKPDAYMAVVLEVLYDPSQSLKRGKSTDQLIIDFKGVQITAIHIKLSTKDNLALGTFGMPIWRLIQLRYFAQPFSAGSRFQKAKRPQGARSQTLRYFEDEQ